MAKLVLTPSNGFVRSRSKARTWQPKESMIQAQVFDWTKWARAKYPDLDLAFAIPNGMPIHGPQRFAIINSFKQQGLQPGYPDFGAASARGGYFSYWCELKVRGGKVSEAQQIWINRLRAAGAYVVVADSYEQAIAELEMYCRLPPTKAS